MPDIQFFPAPAAGDASAAQADIDAHEAESVTTVHGGIVPSFRTLTAGNGLSGGGDLSANRTITLEVDGSTLEISSDAARIKDLGVTTAKLAADAVTYAKLQNVSAAERVLGLPVGASAGDAQELTAAQLRAILGVYSVVRTTDATAVQSSTTMADDSVLVLNSLPTGTFIMDGWVMFTTATAADFKAGFAFTGTATLRWGAIYPNLSLATAIGGSASPTSALADVLSMGGFDGVQSATRLSGVLVVTATGNLKFQWAQVTSTAADTLTKAGSYLMLRQV